MTCRSLFKHLLVKEKTPAIAGVFYPSNTQLAPNVSRKARRPSKCSVPNNSAE
jgi:hypothetical protein